jgi:hypothetical protein
MAPSGIEQPAIRRKHFGNWVESGAQEERTTSFPRASACPAKQSKGREGSPHMQAELQRVGGHKLLPWSLAFGFPGAPSFRRFFLPEGWVAS